MAYLRFSLQRPRVGQFQEVRELEERIVKHLRAMDGCEEAFLILARDSEELGRITIWRSEDDAERAAHDMETMALRSQLGFLTDGEGVERSFETSGR